MTEGQGQGAPEGFVGGPGSDHTGTLHLGAWVPTEKPADRLAMADYLEEEAVRAAAGTPVFYKPQGPLNQSQTPRCVGHCGRHWELADPNPETWQSGDSQAPSVEASHLYDQAQQYDGIALPHDGSTNHGLIIALQHLGKLQGDVAWAQSADDVLAWLRTRGPVMYASEWDHSMFQPDGSGYITPDGNRAGGHSYLLFGCWANDDVALWQSWGQWGVGGSFTDKITGQPFTLTTGVAKLTKASLQTLFNDGNAEGCAPIKVGQAPPPPPPQPQPQHKPDWQINGGYERYASNVLVFRGPNAAWGSSWRVYGWYELHADKSVTYYPPIGA